MPSQYIAKEVEDDIYKRWEKGGFFAPRGKSKKTFSMILPPPNVTGTLHMGHAAMLAIEDIMVRYHRMKGDRTWWIPGTDHAAIATQTKVEKMLLEKTGKTRHDWGRCNFLQKVEEFVSESKYTIHKQLRKMGASLDWEHEAYTLDDVRSRAVRMVFKKMYDDGLIYRGNRIVNWCPRCQSTLADDEVEYKETRAKLFTFRYDKNFPISIATTRPETKFGDTAVAVNPKDDRYKKYIGQSFDVNFCGQKMKIKVIGDEGVDMAYGTGALGVTPAHSQTDFAMYEKNDLGLIKVINEDGEMINVPKEFLGLPAKEAGKKIVTFLTEKGLLEKTENISQNISLCYRCDTVIEPLTSEQWFISVNKKVKIKGNKYFAKGASLKEVALKVVRDGEIKIIPEYFEKTYFNWMENLRDWCISRQIWFGHQIPVWYCDNPKCERHKEKPGAVGSPVSKCPCCGLGDFRQDQDTLDTWFSSGLWTFTTMLEDKKYETIEEWIKNSPKLKEFHPTSVLETGYDILFFWVARMILMTTYAMGEIPFEKVYLHGLVRDDKGRKMSKSLGNVIDPLEMIEKYGADATRLSLFIGTSAGTDVKLNEQKVAGYRNFANKIWNASRFVMMNLGDAIPAKPSKLNSEDGQVIKELKKTIQEVTKYIEVFDFNHAADLAYHYFWHTFCDKIIEVQKTRIKNGEGKEAAQYILYTVLTGCLKLLHPFMPFVTEAVWQKLPKEKEGMLIIENWPE